MPSHRSAFVTAAFVAALLLAATSMGVPVVSVASAQPQDDTLEAPYEGGTWSVVAIDPETGDVGVAAATCLPIDVTALAALAPRKGAASVQADFEVDNRNALLQRLDQGERADDIVAALSSPEHDEKHAQRQYGVVTLHDGEAVTAFFSGDHTRKWKGRAHSAENGVTVQGNYLLGPEVVNDALVAFLEPEGDEVILADRLMRALEAGSAAGGDWRCNDQGVVQTAMSAFVSVARADQPPFAARHLGDTGTDFGEYPWIHLSAVDVENGANPIVELRRTYDEWRAENLPPCDVCPRLAIAVPPGGDGLALSDATAVGPATETPEGAGDADAADAHDGDSDDVAEGVAASDESAHDGAADDEATHDVAPVDDTVVADNDSAGSDSDDIDTADADIADSDEDPQTGGEDDGPPTGAIIAIFVAVGGGLIATFLALSARKDE